MYRWKSAWPAVLAPAWVARSRCLQGVTSGHAKRGRCSMRGRSSGESRYDYQFHTESKEPDPGEPKLKSLKCKTRRVLRSKNVFKCTFYSVIARSVATKQSEI